MCKNNILIKQYGDAGPHKEGFQELSPTRPYVDKADHEVNMKVKQKDTKLAKALHSLNEKV